MNDVAGFSGIAPYLKDPLVLIGFFLLLAFSFSRYLVKQGIIRPLPTASGYRILKSILLYGFIIAILLIVLGFALRYQELATQQQKLNKLGTLLRDALDRRSSLPEEKKIEIINRVLEAYRSGALPEEQVERWTEELKDSPTQAVNHIQEFNPSINQQTSDNHSRGGSNVPAPAATSAGVPMGSPPQSYTDPVQYAANPALNTEERGPSIGGHDPPANAGTSFPLLIRPFNSAPQSCNIKITSPSDGAVVVNRLEVVSGTAELPTGYLIWVLIQHESNDWKPLGVATLGDGGKWSVPVAFQSSDGRPFNIGAVAARENTINDAKSKSDISDTTLANLGCSSVKVSLNRNLSSKQANCGVLRTVLCRAYRCDCEDNVGCIGYNSAGEAVENTPCPSEL